MLMIMSRALLRAMSVVYLEGNLIMGIHYREKNSLGIGLRNTEKSETPFSIALLTLYTLLSASEESQT